MPGTWDIEFMSHGEYMCNGGRELDNKHHLRFITLYSDPHPTCGLLPVGFSYINMAVGLPTIT